MTKQVIIFGGNGFIGRYIVRRLANLGYLIKVFTRNPESAMQLKLCGHPGQIVIVSGDVLNEDILEHIKGCDVAINLIGIFNESATQDFFTVHVSIAEKIAQAANESNVPLMIHFSAAGIENSLTSKYAQSKILGEKAVISVFSDAIIIKPSLVFGKEDKFFNKFAKLASMSLFLPLICGGKIKFQPIYVDDLARLICHIISINKHDKKFYYVGGPKTYSMKNLLKFILSITNRNCLLVNIPLPIAKLIAFICEFKIVSMMLKPITGGSESLITRDQIKMMCSYGNVEKLCDLEVVKIRAMPMENIVPEYLKIYKKL